MEEGKGNEGQNEVTVTVTPSHAEVPTFEDDVHDEDKKNNVTKNGACDVIFWIVIVCLLPIILIGIWMLPRNKDKKNGVSSVIRCIFVCLVGILIASFTVPKLKDTLIWGLKLWEWTIFVLVIFCGRLISNWSIRIPHALIKAMNLRVVSLSLVYEMKKSVRPFIWIGLILLVWVLLINPGLERSKDTTKILAHVTDALVGGLAVAAIWFAKSLLIKLLAFSFQHDRFLDRIEKISFKLHVVKTLLTDPSPPKEKSGESNDHLSDMRNKLQYFLSRPRKQEDLNEGLSTLLRNEREKVFDRIREAHMYEMIRSWISDILGDKEDGVQKDIGKTRNSKVEDKAAADAETIFRKVTKPPGCEDISKEDLMCYLKKEDDVDRLLRLDPRGTETKKIEKSYLKKWMVESYKEFEALAHSLDYTKITLGILNRLVSGIAIVIGIIVWCLMMGIFTTRVLVLISSQILLASFMFGNTVKTMFEAIIFVFLMHPFDVGDQCVIDEEQMVVEEIKILYTIFHRNDMQKLFYPNSVLLTKPIRNSFRNPETDDSVEFNIDLSTSAAAIASLKERIKVHLERNSKDWLPNHRVVVKDIDNSGNLKMSLCVTHKINLQSSEEKSSRRSDLILALREILDELKIKYRLLPQEVHVKYIETKPETTPSASLAAKC